MNHIKNIAQILIIPISAFAYMLNAMENGPNEDYAQNMD